jgi:hypothetical protein
MDGIPLLLFICSLLVLGRRDASGVPQLHLLEHLLIAAVGGARIG